MLDWLGLQGAECVTAEVAVENAASNRLLGKLGFVVERTARFRKYHMDITYDSYIYEKKLNALPSVDVQGQRA